SAPSNSLFFPYNDALPIYHPARLEPRVDDDSRPAHLEDEGGVHDARHAEIGIRGMVDGVAGEGDGGAGRGERGRPEGAVRPHQTLPSWRSASERATATGVARVRLRTCSLGLGVPDGGCAWGGRVAGRSPRPSPAQDRRSP